MALLVGAHLLERWVLDALVERLVPVVALLVAANVHAQVALLLGEPLQRALLLNIAKHKGQISKVVG